MSEIPAPRRGRRGPRPLNPSGHARLPLGGRATNTLVRTYAVENHRTNAPIGIPTTGTRARNSASCGGRR
ncbi:hypothetical protein ACQP2F_30290 [Actinoplanes sp. CA-030573]|uniref:hypothetical protein n=1 Tax=Actinoplanes sp. CA-030573 TaxID=3239898 RepID=UPI003D8A1869